MTEHRPIGEAEGMEARRTQALALRIAGATYREIAKALAVCPQTAYTDVQTELEALDKLKAERAERLRDLEVERCDKLTMALWPRAQQGDAQAVNSLVRVMDRRAKLLGLDVPQKVDVNGQVQVIQDAESTLDSKLARLITAISARGVLGGPDGG